MHFSLNLFSFLPDICSFIPFLLSSFCFQSLFFTTMLPMIVPIPTSNKSDLESLLPFLCPKSQPCTWFPLCQAPSPSLSPSTRLLLPSHSHCSTSWLPGLSPSPPCSAALNSISPIPFPKAPRSFQPLAVFSFICQLQSLSLLYPVI